MMEAEKFDSVNKKRRVCSICGHRRMCTMLGPIDGETKYVCSEDESLAREFVTQQLAHRQEAM
jgi:hypothetical protein